jgi:hypothetical protein
MPALRSVIQVVDKLGAEEKKKGWDSVLNICYSDNPIPSLTGSSVEHLRDVRGEQ